jgi:hypothetical protein
LFSRLNYLSTSIFQPHNFKIPRDWIFLDKIRVLLTRLPHCAGLRNMGEKRCKFAFNSKSAEFQYGQDHHIHPVQTPYAADDHTIEV